MNDNQNNELLEENNGATETNSDGEGVEETNENSTKEKPKKKPLRIIITIVLIIVVAVAALAIYEEAKTHICYYPGCDNWDKNNGSYCEEHACENGDCIYKKSDESNSIYCEDHECKKDGCTELITEGDEYCEKHANSQSVTLSVDEVVAKMDEYLGSLGLGKCEIELKSENDNGGYSYSGKCVDGLIVFVITEANDMVNGIYVMTPVYNENVGALYTTAEKVQNIILNLWGITLSILPEEQMNDFVKQLSDSMHQTDDASMISTASGYGWTCESNYGSMIFSVTLNRN